MRVDQLELRNFKKFAEVSVSLHPRFTLLVGENGAGKTSILDALAVSLGVWLVDVHDSLLANSKRPIDRSEKRLESIVGGDRTQLQQAPGIVSVCSKGQILDRDGIEWGQEIRRGKNSVTNSRSKDAMAIISDAYARAGRGEKVLLPVIAYYGAGRAWLPHNQRKQVKAKSTGPSNRWEAFYDCLNDRIRLSDLNSWFRAEAIERGNRGGHYRPGFEVVLRAIINCVPGADAMFYDSDRDQVVLSIDGNPQPFSNLSAGQRTLFSLVADIAIKMVTQNNYLVPPESLGPDDNPLPRVLTQTPGVILIDELDVHLHPKWQRQVAKDLRRTFPSVQFVCTTHSPQVIGEVMPDEIRLLREGQPESPAQSFGMDANWILQALMGADEQHAETKAELKSIFSLIDARRMEEAQTRIADLRAVTGNNEAIQRAASTVERIRILKK